MAEIINLRNVEVDRGSQLLLEDASFSFSDTFRVSLVGANGSGKSTLLKVLAGIDEPSRGSVFYSKNALIEYVPQHVPEELKSMTLAEALLKKIEETRPMMEEWRAYDILTRFGFEDYLDRPLGALSGGEANRAMLARALVVEPEFILLDEPTNHMDSEAIARFETLLQKELKIPFCLVSHDRELLDNITEGTIFLRDKKLYYFGLPYSQAKQALEGEDEARRQRFHDEAKEIKRLKESAERMRNWVKTNSDLAAKYQNLKRRVRTIEEDRTFVSREKSKKLTFGGAELNVKAAIRIEEMAVTSPNGTALYEMRNFMIAPGDRIAILGRNGAGKTSLLKMILSAYSGDEQAQSKSRIKFNPQVKIGYYDQELSQLNLNSTIADHIHAVTPANSETIKQSLISAGFPFKRHQDRIAKLSGGERARLQFVALKLTGPNLLILDEPTNHIDVSGIEHLENQIQESDATFLMVSHDRRFINTVANRFFLIDQGHLREIADLEQYYESISGSQDKLAPRKRGATSAGQSRSSESGTRSARDETSLFEKIEKLEKQIPELADARLREDLEVELEALYAQWIELSER